MVKHAQKDHFQNLIMAGGQLPPHDTNTPVQPAWHRLCDLKQGDRNYLNELSEFVNLP